MKTSRPAPQRRRRTALAALVVVAALSTVTAAVAREAATGPTVIQEPSISGVALVGRTLEANRGTWTGTGNTYTYRWLRCEANAGTDSSSQSCVQISGADSAEYTIVSSDIGFRLRVRVKATNRQGNSTATSEATSVVSTEGGKPASSSAPAVSGAPVVGSTLTGNPGTWVGDPPITYTYAWLRCDRAGNACKQLGGKTKSTYKVVQGDVGRTLRFAVRARNSRGTSDAFSSATDAVQDASGGGIIVLPDGSKSVDVSEVPKGERLIVDQVRFDPNPITSRDTQIVTSIKVKDTRGYVVRNAVVFIRSTPILTSGGDNATTATDGWVRYALQPRDDFPLRTGYSVQFFVKAYRKGDPTLAGISGSRLVQVATQTP